jgi:hypothetical protein
LAFGAVGLLLACLASPLCHEGRSAPGGRAQRWVEDEVGRAAAVAESAEQGLEELWEAIREHLKKTETDPGPEEDPVPEPTPPPPPPPPDDDDCQIRYPYSASNFRKNLACLTHNNYPKGPPGYQAHHIFPQNFVDDFDAILGENELHNPRYGTWWENHDHLTNVHQYQQQWENYLNAFRPGRPTLAETLDFGRSLALSNGLTVYF